MLGTPLVHPRPIRHYLKGRGKILTGGWRRNGALPSPAMARRKRPLTEAHAMAPIVGANIRRARKLKKLTQQQLAEKIGVHPARISEFERGLHEPRISRLHEIAAALNIPVNQLITRQRHKNS